jgi:hypothetical protein
VVGQGLITAEIKRTGGAFDTNTKRAAVGDGQAAERFVNGCLGFGIRVDVLKNNDRRANRNRARNDRAVPLLQNENRDEKRGQKPSLFLHQAFNQLGLKEPLSTCN